MKKAFNDKHKGSPVRASLKPQFNTNYYCEPDFIETSVTKIESMKSTRQKCSPAVFLAAGSGCGKTRFLMEMWRYYYNNAICLFTTFNEEGINPSCFLNEFDGDLNRNLAERIFYAYVRLQGYNYDWKHCPKKGFYFKDIETVVKLIRNKNDNSKKIVILVDEFLKIKAEPNDRFEVLHQLFSLKDKIKNCFVVVTGLYVDPSFIQFYAKRKEDGKYCTQSSNRPIEFISLPKFEKMKFIKNIIGGKKIGIPTSANKRIGIQEIYKKQKKYTLANLCNLCGNHPRSLVLAAEAFNSVCKKDLMAKSSVFLNKCVEITLEGVKSQHRSCQFGVACKILAFHVWNIPIPKGDNYFRIGKVIINLH